MEQQSEAEQTLPKRLTIQRLYVFRKLYYHLKCQCMQQHSKCNGNSECTYYSKFALSPTNPSICPGSSVTINASHAAHNYSWTPTTGLNATTGIRITANPIAAKLYKVTATGTDVCTSTKTYNVTGLCPKPTGMIASGSYSLK